MPPQQQNPPHGPSQPSGPPPSQRAGNRRSPLPPLLCCRRTSAEWSPRLYMPRDAVCSSLQIDTVFGQLTNGLNFGFWCLSKQDSQPGRWEKYRSDFGCETDVSLPVDSYNGMDLFESIQAWNSGQIYVGNKGRITIPTKQNSMERQFCMHTKGLRPTAAICRCTSLFNCIYPVMT